jgi:hypothetical protein
MFLIWRKMNLWLRRCRDWALVYLLWSRYVPVPGQHIHRLNYTTRTLGIRGVPSLHLTTSFGVDEQHE